MDIDLSESDMSRLTTMLTRVIAPFARGYGPQGIRVIEVGNVEFDFSQDGTLVDVSVREPAINNPNIGANRP